MSHTLQEEVWLKFLRAAVTLVEQEEWEMVLEEGSPEGEDTSAVDFKVGCCSSQGRLLLCMSMRVQEMCCED